MSPSLIIEAASRYQPVQKEICGFYYQSHSHWLIYGAARMMVTFDLQSLSDLLIFY